MSHSSLTRPNPVVLSFAPKARSASNARLHSRVGELQSRGFEVLRSTTLRDLYKLASEHLKPDAPAMVLLSREHEENCTAATYLRTLYPNVGIVVIADSKNDETLAQILQSGADYYCLRDSATPLLVAILFRLLWRMGDAAKPLARPASAPAVQLPKQAEHAWSLQEQAWVLVSPEGVNIPLTTGERAFLTALLAAPEKRATHQQLIDAVNGVYAQDAPPTHPGRLGVLISRMRKKFSEHGIDMPLRSVHNWGYMFTGVV